MRHSAVRKWLCTQLLLSALLIIVVNGIPFDSSSDYSWLESEYPRQKPPKMSLTTSTSTPSTSAPRKRVHRRITEKAKSFFRGVGKTVTDTVAGMWHVLRHPRQTFNNIKYAITNQKETKQAIKNSLREGCADKALCAGQITGILGLSALTFGAGASLYASANSAKTASAVGSAGRLAATARTASGVGAVASTTTQTAGKAGQLGKFGALVASPKGKIAALEAVSAWRLAGEVQHAAKGVLVAAGAGTAAAATAGGLAIASKDQSDSLLNGYNYDFENENE